MKRLLLCISILCFYCGVSVGYEPLGVVAYKGKINYQVFTGYDVVKARLDVTLLRDAGNLSGVVYYLLADRRRKLAWIYLASEDVNIWQENDGKHDLDVVDIFPTLPFALLNGRATTIRLELGGFARQKSVETGFVPTSAGVVKNTVVDAFKAMPIKGIAWTQAAIDLSAATTSVNGMGWCTGNLRYNRKLTKDLNTTAGILGDIVSAMSALQSDLEDQEYVITVIGGG